MIAGMLMRMPGPAKFIGLALMMLAVGSADHAAADPSPAESPTAQIGIDGPQIGIDGLFRSGHWTRVAIGGTGEMSETLEIITRDGDGVEVAYRNNQPDGSDSASGSLASIEETGWRVGHAIPGNESAPLIIRSGSETIFEGRFPALDSLSRRPVMIAKETPWLVSLGDPLGLDQTGVNLTRKDSLVAVSQIEPESVATSLPSHPIGFDGVDWITLNGSSLEACRMMSTRQADAMVQWVRQGGRLFLCLGERTPELIEAAPWLNQILAIDLSETATLEPSRLEAFTSSQSPLDEFEGVLLPRDEGDVILMGRTTRRAATPMAVRYHVGFGTVMVAAMDLDSPMFAQWPERGSFLKQLLPDLLDRNDGDSGRVVQTAYRDLAGQLRSSMDRFSGKRMFGFSLLSLCILGLIAAIGPLDHWVINRFLGRPLLGWLTFPIVTLGLAGLLLHQSRANGLDDGVVQDRRLELIDVDLVNQTGRATAIDYLYSHDAIRFDQKLVLGSLLDSISETTQRIATVPLGQPGETFGGIELTLESDQLPKYQVAGTQSGDGFRMEMSQVPMAPRSSKGMLSRVNFRPALAGDFSLQQRPGSQLLQGELVNPMPVDLLDGKLIYKNWVYLLPTRVPAGGTVASVDSLRQKNFRWQLTRQKALESSSQGEPWNPTGTASVARVAEMMMYHEAAGGVDYTGLEHGPLGFLDFSDRLDDQRCLLVGRLAEPIVDMQLSQDDQSIVTATEINSLVRVILPVIRTHRQTTLSESRSK